MMNEDATMLALSAIAHRNRLTIFKALGAAGPEGLSAGEISEQLKIVPSSLSFHLKEMSRAALLSGRREGTYIYYSAEEGVVSEVIDFLIENCLVEKKRRG